MGIFKTKKELANYCQKNANQTSNRWLARICVHVLELLQESHNDRYLLEVIAEKGWKNANLTILIDKYLKTGKIDYSLIDNEFRPFCNYK